MRVLVFGDSITYGKVDTKGGWVNRLRCYYDEQTIKETSRDFPNVYNLGISGDTTEGILKRFDVETQARLEEELVFIFAIGTNDSSIDNSKPRYTKEQFQTNLEKILQKAQKHSGKLLLVGLLPVLEDLTTPIPWRPNRHYTNKQILLFDEIIVNLAEEKRIPYVSPFKPFQKKMENDKTLFPDGLHPNDEGHELIFQLVRPELDRLINT